MYPVHGSYSRKRKGSTIGEKTIEKRVKNEVKKAAAAPAIKPKFSMTAMNLSPFPSKKRTTMVYCSVQTFTPPVLATGITVVPFRFNSLFDPEVTLGGHQPYGFDQWMAIYTRYTVISATARFTINPSQPSAYSGNFGLNIKDLTSPVVTDEQTIIESQYSNHKPYNQTSGPETVTLKLDVAKYFGVHDVMDDDTLSGTNLTDSNKQALLNCWISGDLASTPSSTGTLVITYDVYLHEPREVGAS